MKKKAVEYSLKAQKQEFPIVKIKRAEDAVNFARQFYYDDITIYESAFIILMNNAGNAMGYAKISQGGICGTIVDVRIVAKYAVETPYRYHAAIAEWLRSLRFHTQRYYNQGGVDNGLQVWI